MRNCRYGQFDSAKETFEVVADHESMLDLFICHLNPSAMRRLAQKFEEEGADSDLRRYCERILRVRSTGWTQGIFANFAAESMVPKGPEWGGGNWEIKTPTNLKSIPQWELAAEVMPYMRTDDGTIPSIVTDHIGVYLGLIKGKGNVVEVREDSLVKAFKANGGGVKANGLPAFVATTASNKPKGAPDGESKGDSLMGLETLSQQFSSSSAVDAQAKAEEEFKKSLYDAAADGSSSDEEGTSKTKKLHIRIRDKPVASSTVDLNKIKEATKQLGRPMSRTKSLTSASPDLGLIVPQPAPTTSGTVTAPVVSVSSDPFGTMSLAQPASTSQPSPIVTGGVTAGPIPEDFFQDTISSIQVAASLPPPGTILSRLGPNSQGAGSNNVPANQVNIAATDTIPSGGIPPQTAQQPVMYEPVGLPDGGIPPQSMPQSAALPQPQIQMTSQVPISSQPLDLSALEPPGSEISGKTSALPASPKAVRPGQVNTSFLFSC